MSITTDISAALNNCQALRESKAIANCYNLPEMQTVEEIRRQRLKALVTDLGSLKATAEALGKSSAQVSQWLNASVDSKTGKPRSISAQSARGIEKAIGKPRGWMDGTNDKQANIEQGPDVKGYIPLISWVSAGRWSAVADPYEVGDAEQWVPCPVSHGNHTFVLRVRGMSMEPEYRDGDWIFVDPDRQPENGSHVVVRLEDEAEATFKKLVIEGDRRYLMALNPGWPDRVIEINGNAHIVGTVIFSGKPR